MFWTTVHSFLSTCHALKTWFELTRVKLHTNDLGIKNYFELAGGSSYQRVKLQ